MVTLHAGYGQQLAMSLGLGSCCSQPDCTKMAVGTFMPVPATPKQHAALSSLKQIRVMQIGGHYQHAR